MLTTGRPGAAGPQSLQRVGPRPHVRRGAGGPHQHVDLRGLRGNPPGGGPCAPDRRPGETLQETHPSVVTFSYLHLSAGTSSVTVYAVAASVGRFVLPPILAFADDQPELMGMMAAGTFTVCADCTAPTYGEVPPPPKSCRFCWCGL